MTEILFSCLAIFVLSGLIVNNLSNYFSPIGFEYKNLINLNVYWPDLASGKKVNIKIMRERYKTIYRELKGVREVENISWSSFNLPYTGNYMSKGIKYKSVDVSTGTFEVDDNYLKVTGLKLLKGRWFDRNDNITGRKPVVINQELAHKLFGENNALGEKVLSGKYVAEVIGIVGRYKYNGEYTEAESCMFFRNTVSDTITQPDGCYLIKLRHGSSIMTDEKITKIITSMYPDANVTLNRTEDLRTDKLKPYTFDTVIAGAIGGFLIFNISLGLFGILWQNINKRKKEIGLRRALGASAKMIYMQIVGEVLVLSTISILLGVICEAQIVILNPFDLKTIIYISGIFISIIFIYLVTALCAAYPAHLASGIQAAEALHDE
jgi:putative ABC transport system permease protein